MGADKPMAGTTLIVPGYHGSGADHWQTWLEQRVSGARRIGGIDWEAPVLADWAAAVRREILRGPGPVWLVAHSFGCLAAVAGTRGLGHRVQGAMLVAPADPDRFTPRGFGADPDAGAKSSGTLATVLPRQGLGFPSLIVASTNDPWMSPHTLLRWAGLWGSRVFSIGRAGHINTESGFGPWPLGLDLLRCLPVAAGLGRRRADPAGG